MHDLQVLLTIILSLRNLGVVSLAWIWLLTLMSRWLVLVRQQFKVRLLRCIILYSGQRLLRFLTDRGHRSV